MESLSTAAQLFLDVGDGSQAAWCKCAAGDIHRRLSKYDQAETLLNEAQNMYQKLGNDLGGALCRLILGDLMRMKHDFCAAIDHFFAARQTFIAVSETFQASQCTRLLGLVSSIRPIWNLQKLN